MGKIHNLHHAECLFSPGNREFVIVIAFVSTGLFVHLTCSFTKKPKVGAKGDGLLCIWFQTYSAGYFFGNRATVTLQFLNVSPAIQKNLYILLVNKSLLYVHPTCLFHVSAGL